MRLVLMRPSKDSRVEAALPGERLRLDVATIWPGNDYMGGIHTRLERATPAGWVLTHCHALSRESPYVVPAGQRQDCVGDQPGLPVPNQKDIVLPREIEPGIYRLCEHYRSQHRSPVEPEPNTPLPAPVVGCTSFRIG